MKTLEKTEHCPDCHARISESHTDGCDVARCLWDGGQRLQCEFEGDIGHDCGSDTWTGHWPGEVEAIEFGWWIYWGPGWIRCSPDHPGARPDLNRLHLEATWDRDAQKWVNQ